MYVKKANIFGFGKLIDTSFDFHKDYQVIRGLNESGKTTLLSFIKSILFGFSTASGKNKYDQYIPKNASQYGGELVIINNDDEWLIRRTKGKKGGDVTLFKNNVELPESELAELLKTVDKSMYESVYDLNQNNIGKAGELDRQDLITEVLTVGAIGGTSWLELMKDIEKDSGNIYRPSANAKKPLNQELKAYQELLDTQKNYQNQKADFDQKNSELKQQNDELSKLNQQRDQLNKTIETQKSFLVKKDQYEEYLNLSDVGQQPRISNDDWDQFNSTEQKIQALDANIKQLQNQTSNLSEADQQVLANYENNQEAIKQLTNNLDEVNRDMYSLDQLKGQIEQDQKEKERLLSSDYKLTEMMTPLSKEELQAVNQTDTKKNLYWMILGIGIFIVLLLALPGSLKIGSAIGILIAGWFLYQHLSSGNHHDTDIFSQHNYGKMTVEEALILQPSIIQIQNLNDEIKQLIQKNSEISQEVELWQNQISSLNIVASPTVKNVTKYLEEVNYLSKKQTDLRQTDLQKSTQVNELSQQLLNLKQQQNELMQKYQIFDTEKFINKRQTDIQSQDQSKRKEVLIEALTDGLINRLKDNPAEFDETKTRLEQNVVELSRIETDINQLTQQLAASKVALGNLANDEDYLRLEQDLAEQKDKIIELYDSWVADELAVSWIYETLNLATKNRFPKMLERSKKYFNILTDNHYTDIIPGDKNIEVQSSDQQKYELMELSTGTIAQLYISLRCAFVMEISDIVSLPILIDDAFSDFDKKRYENALELIKEMSTENQIFYVTTNNSSVDYFEKDHVIDLGGYDDQKIS